MSRKEPQTAISVLSDFKNHLVDFFDDLIALFPEEGDLLYMRIFIKDRVPIVDVMKRFVVELDGNSGRVRSLIKKHDDIFFLERNLFDDFSKSKASHFKGLWTSPTIDDSEREVIWNWMHAFVILVDNWKKVTDS